MCQLDALSFLCTHTHTHTHTHLFVCADGFQQQNFDFRFLFESVNEHFSILHISELPTFLFSHLRAMVELVAS